MLKKLNNVTFSFEQSKEFGTAPCSDNIYGYAYGGKKSCDSAKQFIYTQHVEDPTPL